jgi:NAD(P)-dependent dehydrogenase (short-subunit alcohol dehydrogenase family)
MLEGKIVWVTGAGTGIGLAGARALAASGAIVVMSGRRQEVLERGAEEIVGFGGSVELARMDVTDAGAVERTAAAILERHGRIDILVNSAGVNTPKRFWHDQSPGGWDQVIRVNLDGTFYCCKAVLGAMRAQREGLIINISSWAGIYNSALVGPAYNGSKHAVVSVTETINMEEGVNGIRACAICPGEVDTPIMDSRPVPPPPADRERMLKPGDVGETIRWVADQPAHVCVNEIIISPAWNRFYAGSSTAAAK